MRVTITISRQLGSGGSYIGQIIASRLGLKYVDREVLHLAASELGCDEETIAARHERVTSFWEKILGGITMGAPDAPYTPPPLRNFSDKELFDKQTAILKKIAGKYDCVVVGWAGAFVLPPHERMFKIFCHAPVEFRIQRAIELYRTPSKKEAREMIAKSDEMRKKYFAAMTGREWDCAENFHLSIDTSILPLEEIADTLISILRRKRIVE